MEDTCIAFTTAWQRSALPWPRPCGRSVFRRPARAQPCREDAVAPSSHTSPARTWTAGSASLVPLMAVEMQANQTAAVDAPSTGRAVAGKPVDDITFVKQATESGRKEIESARDALPQLKQPGIETHRRNAGERSQRRECSACRRSPRPSNGRCPLRKCHGAAPSGTASSDFDAKWTAEMIAGHERSVALYRAQAQGGEDKDLRKYASDTLPTIEHHLAELRRLQK